MRPLNSQKWGGAGDISIYRGFDATAAQLARGCLRNLISYLSRYRLLILKYSKYLFGALTALGAVILAIFFIVFYWEQTWSVELLTVQRFLGDSYLEWSGLNSFFFFTLIAGTALITVGMLGIIVLSIKKHRAIFAILITVLIPLLVFGTLVLSSSVLSSQETEKLAITDFRLEKH